MRLNGVYRSHLLIGVVLGAALAVGLAGLAVLIVTHFGCAA